MENSNTTSDLESSGSVSGCDEWLDIIFLVLDGLLCGVIIFGNGLTCFIFLNKAHFRSCFMNTFLVSLALADILMALLVMPGEVIFCTSCNQSISKHCWLIGSVKYLVFPATKLNLLAITFDRYTAVMSPLKYNTKINSKKVFSILTVVWTIPMILTISRLAWWIKLPKNRAFYVDRVFNSCLIFSLVILPVTIVTVANLRIMLEIRKQRCRVRTTNDASVTETRSSCKTENNENTRKTNQTGRKGTMACVLVVLIFVVCWLPRGYYNILRLFGKGEGPLLKKLSMFLLFVQSAINPFVYSFYRADFRSAVVRLLRCR